MEVGNMTQSQIYEGTPEQIVKQLSKLPKTRKYKVTVISEEVAITEKKPKMITFGMFPELLGLTEEDIKSAEWLGEEI